MSEMVFAEPRPVCVICCSAHYCTLWSLRVGSYSKKTTAEGCPGPFRGLLATLSRVCRQGSAMHEMIANTL